MEFGVDEQGQEILLKDGRYQVMMAWEKPYMEACIDALKPSGDVLEVGFGLGYSANRIQSYRPKSHTIIECDFAVIARAKEWAKGKANVMILEKTWQEALATLGKFDAIFFDDYPLDQQGTIENVLSASVEAEPIVRMGRHLMTEQEKLLPQMKAQQYSDADLQELVKFLPAEEKKYLPKFLLELYGSGQIKKEQLKPYMAEEEIATLGQRESPARSDRLFEFLLPCLKDHMRKGAKFSCFLESAASKFEDPLFQKYIIENLEIDYSEKVIYVDVPSHCKYYSGNEALVITIVKRI